MADPNGGRSCYPAHALTQLYWAEPVRAFFRPKEIWIYNALLPDVNFGVAGSAIGLCGSLISKNSSTLVTGLRVRAKRTSDGGEYTLDAIFNRKRSVTMAGGSIDADIWTVMQLMKDEPKPKPRNDDIDLAIYRCTAWSFEMIYRIIWGTQI
jgi:hypothetical protein